MPAKPNARSTRSNKPTKQCVDHDYMIHKVTFLSLNVRRTVTHLKRLFGSELVEIAVPDLYLKKRGIRWLKFKKSGTHIHVAPPPPGTHLFLNVIKQINNAELVTPVKNMPIKESHVGVLVPDMTPILKRVQKLGYQYMIRQRADGMYQLYMDLDSAHDYFEVDSMTLDLTKANIQVESFAANSGTLKASGNNATRANATRANAKNTKNSKPNNSRLSMFT